MLVKQGRDKNTKSHFFITNTTVSGLLLYSQFLYYYLILASEKRTFFRTTGSYLRSSSL